MKRKVMLIITVMLSFISFENISACGEIKELYSSVGTISTIGETKYLVTVPKGTNEVTLTGTTDYTWVKGYEPRTVSTKNGNVELKVDGNACGFGTYTYFVSFKEESDIIADNEIEQQDPAPTDQEPDPAPSEPIDYGVLVLSNLKISGVDISFNPETRIYDIEIVDTISKLDITPTTQDSSVTVEISSNVNDLKKGMNTVTIKLSDPYGNTGLYVLNVNKVQKKSSNNFLAGLTIEKYQLNFDPSITEYTVEIGKESVLNISAVTESELASYVILGNTNISDGDTITVRVTAENGETKDYVIKVKRKFNIMDYWIFIVIGLLLFLLLLVFTISKNKKNKKKMGPETIQGENNTAGVIQDVGSQNQNSAQTEVFSQDGVQMASTTSTPGTLRIIEPTNLDTQPVNNENSAVDEDKSPTEIFQL